MAVVNPRQAHHCAKAQRRRAKPAALDARDRAQLAATLRPAPWTPPPAVDHAVRQRPVVVAVVRPHLDAVLAALDRRVAARETAIAVGLKERAWAASLACLTRAPRFGLVTASWLLVGTRHFARCADPEALTAYAGLAPVPRESGRSIRGRATIGHDGNGRLRTALSMATRSAARDNPAITACYQRLRAAGKPPQVARAAAARKLLHQAWALGSKLQRFDPG